LEVLFHTPEEVEEEKNAIFFSDYTKLQYSDEPEPLKVSSIINNIFLSANQIYRFSFVAVVCYLSH
jgi:hypothetical protein